MEPSIRTFADRADAGRRLAGVLGHLRGRPLVVLGLPRGGVPVAFEVARALAAPLDVIVVRKLGVPFQPELGMGAIGEGGVRIVNREIVEMAGVSDRALAEVESRERAELERRASRYRGDRAPVPIAGRTVVVVDDGIATGSTARAACQVARARGAARVVLAVPVAPRGWADRISGDADECVSVEAPEAFFAIGEFYADFAQVSDGEVSACLERARNAEPVPLVEAGSSSDPALFDDEVEVEVEGGRVHLAGHLTVPEEPIGTVVFAHGSGSSRHSPRNRYVAAVLNDARLGTLLFDLLTVEEEHLRANVFDVELLAARLAAATAWLRAQPDVPGLPIGYFGASTGAAAALWASAEPGAGVGAVVSRGGRPDLAALRLGQVTAPTLLIVGGRDDLVLELNRAAQARIQGESRLAVVPGATHLFEEEGALEEVAELACGWFTAHLGPKQSTPGEEGCGREPSEVRETCG